MKVIYKIKGQSIINIFRENYKLRTYIKNTSRLLDFDNRIINEKFSERNIFVSGEVHGTKENTKITFELLKYLNKQYNVDRFLIEDSYINSLFINQYLENGDIQILKV